MSYRQIGGLPPPPLGLAPLSPIPASSSYRMDPGAGILPPPRRSRTPSTSTPSFSTSSFTAGPSSHFASSMFDNRYGAFSVPPQKNYPSLDPSSSSTTDSITPRMTACLPCKRGHLKCGRGMRPCASCIKRGKAEECLEGIPPDQAQVFIRLFREKQTRQLNNNPITGEFIFFTVLPDNQEWSSYWPLLFWTFSFAQSQLFYHDLQGYSNLFLMIPLSFNLLQAQEHSTVMVH